MVGINKKNAGGRIKKIRVIGLDINQRRFAKKIGHYSTNDKQI